LQAYAQDLSCNAALRSIEVPVEPSAVETRGLFSTITSSVFSEIVFVFYESDVRHAWPMSLPHLVRELYGIKECQVVFCLDALDESREALLHLLALKTERAVAAGLYDFLSCPPLVFSRRMTKDDHCCLFY
jgi:hypothetical protein